jgi:antitoxin component YwqK of YwqJK toxin-antitoxin module
MYIKLFSTVAMSFLICSCQRSGTQEPWLEQKYIHKYGLEVQPDYWVDSGCNGQLVTQQRDGVTITQTYSNGLLNGICSRTFPHSDQVEQMETYCNDVLVSQVTYSSFGIPLRSLDLQSPGITTETIWYETGTPRSIENYQNQRLISGEYYTSKNQCDSRVSEGNGQRISRDMYGMQMSVDTFENGVCVRKTSQYPNGAPRDISSINNDQLHGERKTYHPGGEPQTIENWSNGHQDGVTTLFQNGERYAEVPYSNGQKNGVEVRYRDGNVVIQKITWLNDQQHGPTYIYNGDKVQEDWYYYGRPTTRSTFESFGLPKQRG